MKQKKQSLSRPTFLLHETPTKNRLILFQRGRRKIPQRTKLKLIVTVHLAAAGFFSFSIFVSEASYENERV